MSQLMQKVLRGQVVAFGRTSSREDEEDDEGDVSQEGNRKGEFD